MNLRKSSILILFLIFMVGSTYGFISTTGPDPGPSYSIEVDGSEIIPNEVDCEDEFEEESVVGDGSANTPYEIESIEQLQCIGWKNRSAHYDLVSDIDASKTERWDDGRGFKPIPAATKHTYPFKGVLDGKNHSITNLYINRTTNDGYGGLFYYAEKSVIKNLRLYNVSISGWGGGAVAWKLEGSNVSNIKISGRIKGNKVGSIAAIASNIEELVPVENRSKNVDIDNTTALINESVEEDPFDSEDLVVEGVSNNTGSSNKEEPMKYETVIKNRITRIQSNATLSGQVGGIVYENEGVISESVFEGKTDGFAAGIAYYPGEIKNSYSNATIILHEQEFDEYAGDERFGGIIGAGIRDKITNSFSISIFENKNGSSAISGDIRKSVGPVIGYKRENDYDQGEQYKFDKVDEKNVYWEKSQPGLEQKIIGDVKALSSEEFKNELTALDLGRKWVSQEGKYPELKYFSDSNSNTYQDILRKKDSERQNKKDGTAKDSKNNISEDSYNLTQHRHVEEQLTEKRSTGFETIQDQIIHTVVSIFY